MSNEIEEGELKSDEELSSSRKKTDKKRETSSESGEIIDLEESPCESEDVSFVNTLNKTDAFFISNKLFLVSNLGNDYQIEDEGLEVTAERKGVH
jgi:hypothetical protein